MLNFATFRFLSLSLLICFGLKSCALDQDEGSLYHDDRDALRNNEVRESMHRLQVSAEHYAADRGGEVYPTSIDDAFKCYLPGGDEREMPSTVGYANVFTGHNEFPALGKIKDVKSTRLGTPPAIKPGELLYCPLENGKAYAILGGGSNGKALLDPKNPGEVLVLSNLEE